MRPTRLFDCARQPWKHGGGTTTTLACHPEGAALDHFDWRISVAEVDKDGPFSVFPGVDRVPRPLSGDGLDLTSERGTHARRRPRDLVHGPARVTGRGRIVAVCWKPAS